MPHPRRWARGHVLAFRGRDRDQHRIDRPAGPANPYEGWVFAVSVVVGCATLVRLAQPASLDAVTSPALRWVWAVLMTAGGAAAFAGLYWPGNPFMGVYVKRAGIIAMAGALLAYGVAILALGRSGIVVGLVLLALAAASVQRTVQITRDVAAARARLRELAEGGEGA